MPMSSEDFDVLEKQLRDAHEAMSIQLAEKYEEAMRILDRFRKMFGVERTGKQYHIPALENFEQVSNDETYKRIITQFLETDNNPHSYGDLVRACGVAIDRVSAVMGMNSDVFAFTRHKTKKGSELLFTLRPQTYDQFRSGMGRTFVDKARQDKQVSDAEIFNRIATVFVNTGNAQQTYVSLADKCGVTLSRISCVLEEFRHRFVFDSVYSLGIGMQLTAKWYEELKAGDFLKQSHACQTGNPPLESSRLTRQSATQDSSEKGDIDETRCPEGANTTSTEASTIQSYSETTETSQTMETQEGKEASSSPDHEETVQEGT